MIDPKILVDALENAVGLLNPADTASLSKKGAAYEAFVLHVVGAELCASHGWQWHHPLAGQFRFSVRSGCHLEHAMGSYSTVQIDAAWFVPSVTVVGRSGFSHNLDHVVVKRGARSGQPSWNRVRGVVECKNERDQGPGAARDLVGLAAELRLGAQYRLHNSRPFPTCQFVTAGSITATALGVLARWKLDARPGVTPATAAAAPAIAAALHAASCT